MTKTTLPCTIRLVALLLLCLPVPPLFADSAKQDLAGDFENYFHGLVATEGVTGAAFAIAAPDGIIKTGAAGYTDTSRARRIDQNTAFRIASVSKTFAAGLTGLLVQEGRLSWEDRLIDHLPEFRISGDSSQLRI